MSVVFNASADLLKRTTSIPSTGALTMACFVKLVGTNSDGVIIGIDDGGSGDFYFLELETLALEISDGFGHALAMGNLTSGPWYFIATSSVGGASGIKGYIANVDTSAAFTATTGTGGTARTLTNIVVGGDNFGDFPNAKICGVKFWNAALSANELEEEMKQIAPVRQANLNSFFPLLDITNKLVDESGTGGALTAGAGTWENAENPPVPWRAKQRRTLRQAGSSAVTGTIASTLDNATSATSGTVGVSGTIAPTLANATSTTSGTVGVKGSISSTLANATSAMAGTFSVLGSIAATLADATSATAGTIGVKGTVASTLADASCSASGTVGSAVTGTIAVTLGNATCSASGSTGAGTIAITLGDATCSITGTVGASGSVAFTVADASCSMSGAVGEVTGSITFTLDDASCNAQGSVGALAAGGWAESGATAADVDSSATRAVLDGAVTCAVLDS